jgi:peroxiredoxin
MSQTAAVPDLGAIMPDLHLVDPGGRRSTLHATRAAAPAVVYFMRSSTCPVCRGHARALARLADDGRLNGATVVIVAPGDAAEARVAADRIGPATVSVWATGSGHADAGLGKFLALQHSGTFVLDRDGTVRYRRTSAIPTGSFDADEVVSALEP